MNWIVLSTRSGCEHLAKHECRRLGYDAYLPLSSEPPKFDPKPFFPGYLFVDVEAAMGIWRPLNSAKGVTSVLRTGDRPSRVPDSLIELLKRREEGGVITLRAQAKTIPFKKDQKLRVHEGSFAGFEGVFLGVRPQDRILVLLNMLGGPREVEMPRSDVA